MVIKVRGARQHNLKSVDVDLKKNSFTVVTGPSGSGKSSFAFHTLYIEAQRRYLECLGSVARRQLGRLSRPQFDLIAGLSPAIALKQERGGERADLTVAALSEIYDYFRVLYSALGIPHDPRTGEILEKKTAEEVVSAVSDLPTGSKVMVLAPLATRLWESAEELRADLQRQGFVRIRVEGKLLGVDETWELSTSQLEVVVDRLVIRGGASSRLADSVETALQICKNEVRFAVLGEGGKEWVDHSFSTSYRNPRTGFELPSLSPQSFSYHTHEGRCEHCMGKGEEAGRCCPTCQGGRLKPEFLAVLLPLGRESLGIAELCGRKVSDIQKVFSEYRPEGPKGAIAEELCAQIKKRLGFLAEIGLGALELSRRVSHLSGGELQRLRLASQLGAGLSGILYVIDEPSCGLHPAETQKLIAVLRRLRDQGNTLVVVEHDRALIQSADEVLDFGPKAGEEGGYLLAQGTAKELAQMPHSPTGQWLRALAQQDRFAEPQTQTGQKEDLQIQLSEASRHNLKNISVSIPRGRLVVFTGVSGSGKSSLLHGTLYPLLQQKLGRVRSQEELRAKIAGYEGLGQGVLVDQGALGKTSRSSPATYTGAFELIRQLYASLPLSKQRGYPAARFSFNVKGGRCEKCLGAGVIRVDLQFLSETYLPCEACGGRRYNRETQEVLFKGRSIAEVLESSISENAKHFAAIPKLSRILESLAGVGLGYLKLGQAASTLSGGESQRVKIAAELAKLNRHEGENLYLLDEPTSGLHFSDVEVLLSALRSLVEEGHSVCVIEHNEQFVRAADWQIELGPGAGEEGGEICYEGPPKWEAS